MHLFMVMMAPCEGTHTEHSGEKVLSLSFSVVSRLVVLGLLLIWLFYI